MARSVKQLVIRREWLKKGIHAHLDLLMGSVVHAPSHSGHYLTDKVDGKTVTRYIRKGLVKKAGRMTDNHRRVRRMARELSGVNWELLKREAL